MDFHLYKKLLRNGRQGFNYAGFCAAPSGSRLIQSGMVYVQGELVARTLDDLLQVVRTEYPREDVNFVIDRLPLSVPSQISYETGEGTCTAIRVPMSA